MPPALSRHRIRMYRGREITGEVSLIGDGVYPSRLLR